MLHTVRKLAREIHRRSVWQVLAAYLLFWIAGFQAAHLLTRALGLPLWTPTMAFVLLAIGFPVVLATAVVQGGLPGLRIVDAIDPNELEGRSPEEVLVVPEAHPLHTAGVLTWRNAVLGGVMATALLVTSVVAYVAMWAFGIGPVGSLVAQGILGQGDTVAVADFENGTDRPFLGARVRDLLEAELARSTLVRVATRRTDAVSPPLPTAGTGLSDPEDGGTPSRRIRVFVDGAVHPVEAGYRIVTRIRLPDGTVLAGFGHTAPSLEDIDAEVGRLALRLRERFGESLREIRRAEAAALGR